jgi:hypothetical protein
MFNPPKVLTTLFLGAASGFGFYAVSYPVTRLSTFVTNYVVPSSEKSGSTVYKVDRLAAADTFDGRWPHAAQRASARDGQISPHCPLTLA